MISAQMISKPQSNNWDKWDRSKGVWRTAPQVLFHTANIQRNLSPRKGVITLNREMNSSSRRRGANLPTVVFHLKQWLYHGHLSHPYFIQFHRIQAFRIVRTPAGRLRVFNFILFIPPVIQSEQQRKATVKWWSILWIYNTFHHFSCTPHGPPVDFKTDEETLLICRIKFIIPRNY